MRGLFRGHLAGTSPHADPPQIRDVAGSQPDLQTICRAQQMRRLANVRAADDSGHGQVDHFVQREQAHLDFEGTVAVNCLCTRVKSPEMGIAAQTN